MKTIQKTRTILSPFLIFFLAITAIGVWFLFNIDTLIKRGVDLVGGTYITLQVDMQPMLTRSLYKMGTSLKNHVKGAEQKTIELEVIFTKEKHALLMKNISEEAKNTLQKELKPYEKDFTITFANNILELAMKAAIFEEMLDSAINKNIIALRKRIDPMGAGEILIARNQDTIVIELPNVQDPEQARKLIGTTAFLTFRPVLDQGSNKEELEKIYRKMLQNDVTICKSAQKENVWYVLPKDSEITGSLLKQAIVGYDQMKGNVPVIQFSFNSMGGQKFKELTRKCVGKQVAIAIDDAVVTAPMVNEEIAGGSGTIQGNFTLQEAQDLATLLSAGSFEAPVNYVQERVIEPILGAQTIKQGLFACMIGMILLLIASLAMYSVAGIIAFIVLLYNLLFTLFGIYFIGGTLTLSGIAGLILTIGMAIDASILIFEKIKDELRHNPNESFTVAVEKGFKGTMSVIIDANITHFIVALVLYYVGAGPLKGFAITMIVGILSTIISGIFMLKSLFNYFLKNLNMSSLRI